MLEKTPNNSTYSGTAENRATVYDVSASDRGSDAAACRRMQFATVRFSSFDRLARLNQILDAELSGGVWAVQAREMRARA